MSSADAEIDEVPDRPKWSEKGKFGTANNNNADTVQDTRIEMLLKKERIPKSQQKYQKACGYPNQGAKSLVSDQRHRFL